MSKYTRLVSAFGEEALRKLSDDLSYLGELATGREKVSAMRTGPEHADIWIYQTAFGVTQSVLVARDAIPRFVAVLRPVLAGFGYTIIKE